MSMNLNSLTESQRGALLDLLVLGIYSDGHFASAEDAAIHQLLGEMGLAAASDQDRAMDAAITRVRKHIASVETAQKYAADLTLAFPARDQRRQVHERLKGFLNIDNKLTMAEKNFATVVGEALRL